MAIDNEYINIALVQTEENRKKAVRMYEMQVDILKKTNTEFSEINSLLSEIGSKIAITAMRGDEKLLKSYEDRATLFKKKKDAMLTEAGIGTAPDYFCKKCNDSGYHDGKLCECVETRAKAIAFEKIFGVMSKADATFENFSLTYYPAEKDESGYSPKKVMSTTLKLCQEFCENFPEGKNLLFIGESGLGKTHLSFAIAAEIAMKGFTVVYGTAQNLLSKAVRDEMDWNSDGDYVNQLLDCDLLIIDDLGTEFSSAPSNAMLYNIINTRLLAGNSTVISTNLSFEEIEKKYDPRIASRLIGNYTCRQFLGKDIRQLKVIEKRK